MSQRSRRGIGGSCQTTSGLCGPGGRPASSLAVSIMPAPTVSNVVSSTRMNAPETRLREYGSASSGAVVRRRTVPMSLSSSSAGRSTESSVAMSTRDWISSIVARTRRVVCLSS